MKVVLRKPKFPDLLRIPSGMTDRSNLTNLEGEYL